MFNPVTTLVDFIIDLFRSPASAAAFVSDPEQTLRDAGLPNVTAAQLASVAATAAPAGVALGGGNPVVGLQRAVADYHSIASPFSPQTSYTAQPTFAPNTNTDLASHNDTSFMSPNQDAGANAQHGVFNLGLGDITLGDKTSNTATNGGVVADGNSDSPIVTGDGAVLGHGNTVNNGDILAGSGSNVAVGEGNGIDDNSKSAGGDLISGNDGPVISHVDQSGGHGGDAGADGAGGLLGIGGSEAHGGSGGNAGSIILSNNDTHAVGGDQTAVGGDYGSGNSTALDSSAHSSTSTTTSTHGDSVVDSSTHGDSVVDSSTHGDSVVDSSTHGDSVVDSSTHGDTSVHDDSSVHSSVTDDSVHQSGALNSNLGLDNHPDTDLAAMSHNDTPADFHGF